MEFMINKRLLPILLLLFMLVSEQVWAKEPVFLLSPDAEKDSVQLISADFEKYLSQYGDYSLQIFDLEEKLERQIEQKPQAIVMIPAENYRQLFKKYQLTVLAIGLVNGVTTHQQVFVARQGTAKENLSGTVAMPYSESEGKIILQHLLGKQQTADLEILTVPKGIDGLMSVGFGMAEFAIINLTAFKQISRVNSRLIALLKQLVVGDKQYNMLVCAPLKNKTPSSARTLTALQEMKKTTEGQRLLKFLELDGWQKATQMQQVQLERTQ